MTFVYNYVAVRAHHVIDHSSSVQALNHAYIQFAIGGDFPSAEGLGHLMSAVIPI